MKNLENYAKKILTDAGCDIYTYGSDGMDAHIMDDLKEAFPDGMDFPYIDVANAILSMSRPRPIERKPYKVSWETDNCCDCFYADSLKAAEYAAEDTLIEWMMEAQDDSDDDWNYMIYNCGVSVLEYNKETDEYEEFWSPSEADLKNIGWSLR